MPPWLEAPDVVACSDGALVSAGEVLAWEVREAWDAVTAPLEVAREGVQGELAL